MSATVPIPDAIPELGIALDAAIKAGQAVMEIYKNDFSVATKGDDSPVTEADLASNRIIAERLAKSGYHILSEEDKDEIGRLSEKRLWIVDPLDGTADFVGKTGEFTIMIALVEDKRPILGVINWPAGNTIYAAQKERGAFEYHDNKWKKITVRDTGELGQAEAIGSRTHLSDEEKKIIKKLGISNFTSIGSSLKVCKIASGRADVYLTTTDMMKEWDSCASSCIISEAGGMMTDMNGNEITYNNKIVNHKNGILVTNGILHNKILEKIRDLD